MSHASNHVERSSDVKLIAEIGCNHMGNASIAAEMVQTAAVFCQVDVIKFQKRRPREALTEATFRAPHPVPENAFGSTYGEHREFLELDVQQHAELKGQIESLGAEYMTSVWDCASACEIVGLKPRAIKVPSAKNEDRRLLDYLIAEFPGEIHVSVGMISRRHELQLVELFSEKNRARDLVIYACTSGYPVPDDDVCLLEISRLIGDYAADVAAIGFSGHHNGIALDIAAVTLGAKWIERHFTLNRTWKGTDHAASLEADGMRRLRRDLTSALSALRHKPLDRLLEIEQGQYEKLKQGRI